MTSKKQHILMIEDDEIYAQVMEIGMKDQDYDVTLCHNGREGIELATSNQYDLVLLDFGLPEVDGLGVCRALRDAGLTMPIAFLTGFDEASQKVAGLDTGADDYMVKPIAIDEFFARLRALLRRREFDENETLTVKDLTLDPRSREVRRGDTVISLMPKEFELLHYMMLRQDKALSRQEILQNVWSVDYRHASNRLETYIKHLRRKVDHGYGQQLIQTVRGVGYKISDLNFPEYLR